MKAIASITFVALAVVSVAGVQQNDTPQAGNTMAKPEVSLVHKTMVKHKAKAKHDKSWAMIQKSNNEYAALLKNKDMDGFNAKIASDTTSDFQYVEDGKTMDAKTMETMMKGSMDMMDHIKVSSAKVLSVKHSKSGVSAKVTHHMVYTGKGSDNKTHLYTFTGDSVDSMRMEDGMMKMYKMAWGKDRFTQDGKKFNPMDMGGGTPPAATGGGPGSPESEGQKPGADGGGPMGKGGGK